MRVLIQRSLKSEVLVDNKVVGKINKGLVLLVGFTNNDNKTIIDKMIEKIIYLRIFSDENDLMNLNIIDVKGQILSISQFTLYANTKKGRRPSFENTLEANKANELYAYFNNRLRSLNIIVETGIFGSNMKANIINDGPVTIMLDSNEI